jgi:hypothetical protein
MAFTAVAAIISGAEVTTALVLSAAAEIGTAMTVVGAVTGNKELMKIGGAVALVGGVGGLINGAISGAAGAAGAAEGAAGAETLDSMAQTASDAFGGEAATEAAQQAGITQMEGAATQSVGTDLATNATNAAVQAPAQEVPQATQTMGASGNVATPAVESTPVNTSSTLQAPTVNGPTGAVAPTGPATPYDNIDVGGGFNPSSMTAPQDSGSFFNNFSGWAEKNKTLFEGGMKLVGTTFSGMNQSAMWNEKMAVDRARLAQTSYGSQVGIWAPPNPAPGIINGAR